MSKKETNKIENKMQDSVKKNTNVKRNVIVDYKSCPHEVLELLQQKFPYGFNKDLIKFQNAKGDTISGVRIEHENITYLVKVSVRLKEMVQDLELDDDDLDTMKDDDDLMKDAQFDDADDDDDDEKPRRKSRKSDDDDDDDDDDE